MLGAVSPDSFDTLHSYSNTFQMPFLTPWFPEKVSLHLFIQFEFQYLFSFPQKNASFLKIFSSFRYNTKKARRKVRESNLEPLLVLLSSPPTLFFIAYSSSFQKIEEKDEKKERNTRKEEKK